MDERLFPYQETGVEWLASKSHALLGDEMGLGKTAQAITAADNINANRILVLCPAAARINWVREFVRFSRYDRPFRVIKTKKTKFFAEESLVCSYDLADTAAGDFDLLILDEAHFLKSKDTKRSKAVLGKGGLVHRAKRVWALSGTPMPNNPAELWPLLYTFGATALKYDSWVSKFCVGYPNPHTPFFELKVTGAKVSAIPDLKKILSSIMLRRKKDDVMKELPPITYADVVVEPGLVDLENESSFIQFVHPIDRRKELQEILDRERALVEATVGRSGLGKEGMRLLEALAQSVSTLRRYSGLQKVEPVVELLADELESGAYEKVVVFAIHRDVIEGLRVKLAKFKPVTLYGGTDPEKRQKNIDKFMKDPKCRVFIGNIQAAGTAITLTSAHNVVFIEQSWVPGDNAQAAMRCHRIGQTKPVLVRFIALEGSIDEKVSQTLKRKARELTEIYDDRPPENRLLPEDEFATPPTPSETKDRETEVTNNPKGEA